MPVLIMVVDGCGEGEKVLSQLLRHSQKYITTLDDLFDQSQYRGKF